MTFIGAVAQLDGYEDYSSYDDEDDGPANAKRTGDAVHFTSQQDLTEYLGKSDAEPYIIGYFDIEKSESKADYDLFVKTSEEFNSIYKFGVVTDPALLKESNYSGSSVFVYKPKRYVDEKIDKPKARYPSKHLSKKTFVKFIHDKSLPTIGDLTPLTEEYYDNVHHPILYVFIDYDREKNKKGFNFVFNRVTKLAKNHPGMFFVAIANRKNLPHSTSNFDFSPASIQKKSEILVGLRVNELYYTMTSSFSAEHLERFITDYHTGLISGVSKFLYCVSCFH
jgi:hypothetical protein